jgi:hypothetical protein
MVFRFWLCFVGPESNVRDPYREYVFPPSFTVSHMKWIRVLMDVLWLWPCLLRFIVEDVVLRRNLEHINLL